VFYQTDALAAQGIEVLLWFLNSVGTAFVRYFVSAIDAWAFTTAWMAGSSPAKVMK
jgi:hypothetical protein